MELRWNQPTPYTMSKKNRKANIKHDLKNLTPPKILALLVHVTTKLDGNPNFPAPPYTIAELGAKSMLLRDAISEATYGSRHSKIVRDNIVEEVKDMLRTTADYVRLMGRGDAAILVGSGFELAKQPSPVGYMGKPMMERARFSGPGKVKLRWSAEHGRRTYNVYMIAAYAGIDEPQWILIATTSKNMYEAQGLDPYKPYYFCVSAVGPKGEGFKSNAVLGRAA